ncbi:hypothetical protein NQ317_016860 [Molorchus minor]|uniref:DDE Tnp4 domain-containing protein n=1 Tax=Molorchus minor TaxID=1323400 RepID=A0ABQ9JL94_9CUCU|nr:hypothetical protein NQ317_016860 [Molorchus minor]
MQDYLWKVKAVGTATQYQLHSNLAAEFSASDYYAAKDTDFNRIPSEKCMWIWCWYATHEAASFRDVADRFNIALSTLHLLIENVSTFLSLKSDTVIKWPNYDEQQQIATDFSELGFPDVIGCMDGTHVRIDKPETDAEKNIILCRFKQFVIPKKRIRDIFIGYPGSVHDARVFKNSPLYPSLPAKCGNRYILADSAYPCLKHVLTPYRDSGNLNAIERNYNYTLSRCRINIEHTFGILKQKFRQLYHLKLRNISSICHFIKACCVTYNLTRDIKEEIDETIEENDEQGHEYNLHDMELEDDEFEGNLAGHNFRNYIAALIFNQ